MNKTNRLTFSLWVNDENIVGDTINFLNLFLNQNKYIHYRKIKTSNSTILVLTVNLQAQEYEISDFAYNTQSSRTIAEDKAVLLDD